MRRASLLLLPLLAACAAPMGPSDAAPDVARSDASLTDTAPAFDAPPALDAAADVRPTGPCSTAECTAVGCTKQQDRCDRSFTGSCVCTHMDPPPDVPVPTPDVSSEATAPDVQPDTVPDVQPDVPPDVCAFHCDHDGDGVQRDDAANGCTASTGASADCNDEDRGVHPGANADLGGTEAGNTASQRVLSALRGNCVAGVDADCSGTANEGCPSASCDVDHDGFPTTRAGCNPSGLPLDCNDSDPHTFPGAPERCGDGMAQSCVSDAPCVTDSDGDSYPDADDCGPGSAAMHPWATELCNGLDDDCDGVIDEGLSCPASCS